MKIETHYESEVRGLTLYLKRAIFLITFFTFLNLEGEEISPIDLVVRQRADIMAKYIYAKHRMWGTSCEFGTMLYFRHLDVWNNFYEDDPPKRNFTDYFNAFNSLLDSMDLNGFDPMYPVPLDHGGVICNGAHRLTACLLYNKKVVVKRCSDIRDYGFNFFQNLKLETKYLNAMALQYCELKPNCHVMVIFPCATGYEQEIEEIISSYANIVYKVQIPFTCNGGLNLILTMYDGDHWIGNAKNNFDGARVKAQYCFPKKKTSKQPIRAFLVESNHLDQIKACKAKIRSLFQHNQHVTHATDTHEEAIVLARALFNQNSVHCLNYRKDMFFPRFEHYLKYYRIGLKQKENDWFCVDGGAVLAAYGLRDCNDFDILHYEPEIPDLSPASVESHNSYLSFHAFPLDDLLFDPDHYFFYRGVKFCALSDIKKMKMRRNEPKDLTDLSLISQVELFEIPHNYCAMIPPE